jgi:hypothetical protein
MAVYVPPDQPPTAPRILDAIRAGHCFVTESPQGARLTIRSGTAMMGDVLPRPADDRIMLDIGVTNGNGNMLQIIGGGGILTEAALEQDSMQLTLDVPLGESRYVRAQLVDPESGHIRALTNPLYFET